MAQENIYETKFDPGELDYKVTDIHQQTSPMERPATKKDDNKKKKLPFRCFDSIAFLALILAALALILVFIEVSRSLNRSSSTSNQQIDSQTDLQTMQSQMNTIKSIQRQVNESLTSFQTQVNKYSEEISAGVELQDTFEQKLQILKAQESVSSQLISVLQIQQNNLSLGLENIKNELITAKDGLNERVDVEFSLLYDNISTNAVRLSMLHDDFIVINSTLQERIGTYFRPASSCKDISQDSPSGNYWIKTSSISLPVQVYCDTSPRNCRDCSNRGGWARVADLDMTDTTQQCPRQFYLITQTSSPRRTCGRPPGTDGCISTTFSVHGMEYSHVCGRIVGYQIGSPSGIGFRVNTIDSHYVAGYSLTYGSPKQHIWTFANAQGEGYADQVCPCIQEGSNTAPVPTFVGNNYFCDSAVRGSNAINGQFYPDDPLWDGQGCGSTSTCCGLNNPPWFCRQLPRPTTEDIEMRLCENSPPNEDDSPFESVEIYIN